LCARKKMKYGPQPGATVILACALVDRNCPYVDARGQPQIQAPGKRGPPVRIGAGARALRHG
jgi:hypothetical protein